MGEWPLYILIIISGVCFKGRFLIYGWIEIVFIIFRDVTVKIETARCLTKEAIQIFQENIFEDQSQWFDNVSMEK